MLTPRPKPWNMGMMDSIESPIFSPSCVENTCAPSALKFRFDSRMPFVTPVVPPLYRIAAGSSAARFTRGSPVKFFPPAKNFFQVM